MLCCQDLTFVGTGEWVMPGGDKGTYEVETTVRGNVLESSYLYSGEGAGEESKSYSLRMEFQDGNTFQVHGDTGVLGEGYCLDGQCSYTMNQGGVRIEEKTTLALAEAGADMPRVFTTVDDAIAEFERTD